MPWGEIWKVVCSWPAAIAATVRAMWPQLRLVCAGVAGAFIQNIRQQNADHEATEKAVTEFQDDQRRLRVDPAMREQLRRESGKPRT